MTISQFKTLGTRLLPRNRMVLVGAAIASTAIVGSAGMAAAQQFNHHDDQGPPGIVMKCKFDYKQLGYSNRGQCVSTLMHEQHGYGYGGNGHDNGHHHHNGNGHGDGDNDQDDQ